MRQEVRVFVELVYDADATLNVTALHAALAADIERLRDADSASPVELCAICIKTIREEAEIYA